MAQESALVPDLDAATQARLRTSLAQRPRGLFCDIDGTLSAIAPTPESAVLLPGVADLLTAAHTSYAVVAAVSGRAALDARRLVGLPNVLYIGNHGMERLASANATDDDSSASEAARLEIMPAALPYVAALAQALTTLEQTLAPSLRGLRVEHKGVTGTLHVRATADPVAAQAVVFAAAQQVAAASGLLVTQGRLVVELRPPIAVDKGVTVGAVIAEQHLRAAVYLGDDRTDIDAFRMLRRLSAEGVCAGIAVAVLHREAPPELAAEADIALTSIERVPAFLRWLVTSV